MVAITHNCGKDVMDVTVIFYDTTNNGWWLELGFGSTIIEYCPFCGNKLEQFEMTKLDCDIEEV